MKSASAWYDVSFAPAMPTTPDGGVPAANHPSAVSRLVAPCRTPVSRVSGPSVAIIRVAIIAARLRHLSGCDGYRDTELNKITQDRGRGGERRVPSSLIFAALAGAWLVVLVPMVAKRRREVVRTAESALAARVLRRPGSF